MITSEQINEVVEKIVINVNPEKIYLFGSYANGKPTVDSDLDLLVIKDTDAPIYKRNTEVKKYLRGMKIPLDLFVYTPSEVNQFKDSKTAFVNQILEKGKLVYGK